MNTLHAIPFFRGGVLASLHGAYCSRVEMEFPKIEWGPLFSEVAIGGDAMLTGCPIVFPFRTQ